MKDKSGKPPKPPANVTLIEPGGIIEFLPPVSDGTKALRAYQRKPKKFQSPEDLERALSGYLDSLQAPDGAWIKPPTLSGAGLHLGFNSKSWHEPYSKDGDFKPLIDWLKFFVEEWRECQLLMPSKGVYPQGLMSLVARLDRMQEVAENSRDVSSAQSVDDTPAEVMALLEDM